VTGRPIKWITGLMGVICPPTMCDGWSGSTGRMRTSARSIRTLWSS
jgi:hypothetical protein